MNNKLEKLVSSLPEIYQTIYGHSEWNNQASREFDLRVELITQLYLSLAKKLNRPLKVLDLGCAQGLFSLSLAQCGASVVGIDYLKDNIAICQALADENPALDVKFSLQKFEDLIQHLKPGQYDMVLGLSVFHHIIHIAGVKQVQQWLQHLGNCITVMIFELALKAEPLYWGSSQPDHPHELLAQFAYYHQISEFKTHLSPITRPLFVASNTRIILKDFNEPFLFWGHKSHPDNFENKFRRYYFADNFICKLYQIDLDDNYVARAHTEIQNEIYFAKHPILEFNAAKLLSYDVGLEQACMVYEKVPGKLLSEKLKFNETIDINKTLENLLEQLVILENHNLYHDDVRTWNIIISDAAQLYLIDYGSISKHKVDCTWPGNIFQSFFILVNELVLKSKSINYIRTGEINPFNLPEPYRSWLNTFWQTPPQQWRFSLLQQLFLQKEQLATSSPMPSSTDLWIAAQEPIMMLSQSSQLALEKKILIQEASLKQLQAQIESLSMRGFSLVAYKKKTAKQFKNIMKQGANYIGQKPKLKSTIMRILNRIPILKGRLIELSK